MNKLVYISALTLLSACSQSGDFDIKINKDLKPLSENGAVDSLAIIPPEENGKQFPIMVKSAQEKEWKVYYYPNRPSWMKDYGTRDDSVMVAGFIDSLDFGFAGKTKIEMVKWLGRGAYTIKVYKKYAREWELADQKYGYVDDGCFNFDPKIYDYNGDGYADISFHYMTPARGSNEMRIVYLFDNGTKRLRHLQSSQKYPNLIYDKEKTWLVSHAYHGGSTTTFLKIENDSLIVLAKAEATEKATYVEWFKEGKKISETSTDTVLFDTYSMFRDYDPIAVYEENDSSNLVH